MRNKIISSLAGAAFSFAASGLAFAQAPPPAPVLHTWTGFYGGIQFGGGWSDEAVNYSPNDPLTAKMFSGTLGLPGEQLVPSLRIRQDDAVGGVEAGLQLASFLELVIGTRDRF
jgi:outer membrane immunogenic protein